MESVVAQLTISDDEEELLLGDVPDAPPVQDFSLCLVGILNTDKSYNFAAFQERMADLWRPGRGVKIDDIGDKVILFRFYHEHDLKRVMESSPWTFDQSLLLLHELKPGENPKEVEMCTAEFWVQVHGLLAGYFSKSIGVALGNHLGKFIEYDPNNTFFNGAGVMRIKVTLDVHRALKMSQKIGKTGSESVVCMFKYEKLPRFCFICGKMGHIDRYCEANFQLSASQIVKVWDDSIRALPRSLRARAANPWLVREEVGGELPGGSRAVCASPLASPATKAVAALAGNFGASRATMGLRVLFGQPVVEQEAIAMQVDDEKRKRRLEETIQDWSHEETAGDQPRKSPKKDTHIPKNGIPVGRVTTTYPSL